MRAVDRVDVFGKVREHRTDDGERTLCGLTLTVTNARPAAGSLRCTRCVRKDHGPRISGPPERQGRAPDPGRVLDTLAGAIATIDHDELRADRIRALKSQVVVAIVHALSAWQGEPTDATSLLLMAMTVQVLKGRRTLDELDALCAAAT